MKSNMTSKERMICALSGGIPDRVPVAPDISNMIPARHTGKAFWEIYLNQNPPIWKAYLDAVKYFSIDGWFTYADLGLTYENDLSYNVVEQISDRDRISRRVNVQTPDGDLFYREIFFENDVPSVDERMIKEFENDYKKIRHFFSPVKSYDLSIYQNQVKEIDQLGINCFCIAIPGLHNYSGFFEGSLENATYAYYDYPELFEELKILHEKQCLQSVEIALNAEVDCILIGASGNLTLQSPDIWETFSLPIIKKICDMTKSAGKISGIHSCGKEKYIVQRLYEETCINYVNPLEIPPMGDCDMKTIKNTYGDKLALMGNLHTTEVMLNKDVNIVKREALKAISDAAGNGGFVLSTGDQCGRDTPYENIFKLVEVAENYGYYPLDIDTINNEIAKNI